VQWPLDGWDGTVHGQPAIEVNTRARVIITPAGAVDQLSAVAEAGGGRVEETLS
jgi:hypothetical protein